MSEQVQIEVDQTTQDVIIQVTAGGGLGTVTSVAIQGTDGIQVDSGSPIITNGTIVLGLSPTVLSQLSRAASSIQPGDNLSELVNDVGFLEGVQAGSNISIDNTDPLNPIISAVGMGLGDVVGPASSIDNRLALFSGTTGKLIKQSSLLESELLTESDINVTIQSILPTGGGGGIVTYAESLWQYVNPGLSGQVLTGAGVGSPPSFQDLSVNLASQVTGLLPDGNISSAATWNAKIGGSTGSNDNAVIRADGTGTKTTQGSLVYIDDNGKMGLGTSSPSALLTIDGSGQPGGVSIFTVASNTTDQLGRFYMGELAGAYGSLDAGLAVTARTGSTATALVVRSTAASSGDNTSFLQQWQGTGGAVFGSVTNAGNWAIGYGGIVPQEKFTLMGKCHIYNNISSATSFEAVEIGFTSNFGEIGTIAGSGGGTVRDFRLTRGGSAHITLSSSLTTANVPLYVQSTVTAAGTTGNRTINTQSGSVNFAAGASSLTVTSSLATANSIILATVRTDDSNMSSVQVESTSGSFVIYANSPPAAETRVDFFIAA